ncbi:hypothetical protein [Gemmatimonas sp.]|uniref:hypothetical protein n=1 Tax=Gemmatimonas sp. TaxID=1962908 RepID=UPI0039837160
MSRSTQTVFRWSALVTVLATALATGAAASIANAQVPSPDQRERYAPLILKLPASARLLSFGGAQVALRDVDAVFGNPALVGTATALAFGAERYASGATAGQFASSSTIGPLGIGVGVHLLDAGGRYGTFPAPSEVLTRENAAGASSIAATLAASLTWKQLRWGVGAKYVEERVSDDRAGGVVFDIGASKSLQFLNSTVGVAVQHLGRRLSVAGRSELLPTQLALGIATAPRGLGKWLDLSGTVELDVRRDGELFPRGGVELSYIPIDGVVLTGRVGGRRPQLREERPIAVGGGFTVDRVTLDYGWEALRDGAGHRLTLRLR